ncbi:hypothetical protein BE17_21110 [Sorangium cellulosum]|uniref:Uncharacterized protein n=1 Tax=Sorangium cellulosum TaxID=56 RepID=A0A150R0B7_SORCE|nr:hypothetical protein BE17_21110 [Sorangium cellulosum]
MDMADRLVVLDPIASLPPATVLSEALAMADRGACAVIPARSPAIVSCVQHVRIIPALVATTQAEVEAGLPAILAAPAACRALWLEPREAIDLGPDPAGACSDPRLLCPRCGGFGRVSHGVDVYGSPGHVQCDACRGSGGVDWVILRGGDAPVRPAWVTSIRDACCEAGTPFSLLGWGTHAQGSSVAPSRASAPHRSARRGGEDDPEDRPPSTRSEGAERWDTLLASETIDERPAIAR